MGCAAYHDTLNGMHPGCHRNLPAHSWAVRVLYFWWGSSRVRERHGLAARFYWSDTRKHFHGLLRYLFCNINMLSLTIPRHKNWVTVFIHSLRSAAGYISEFFSRHWQTRLQELEAAPIRGPTNDHAPTNFQKARAVTYSSAHSDADIDADTFSDINRDDASATIIARSRENFSSPNNVDPHRRTDEQLARMADLRFTIGSSDAGFYICHSRLSAGTMMSIMLRLSGFIIILDSISESSLLRKE